MNFYVTLGAWIFTLCILLIQLIYAIVNVVIGYYYEDRRDTIIGIILFLSFSITVPFTIWVGAMLETF